MAAAARVKDSVYVCVHVTAVVGGRTREREMCVCLSVCVCLYLKSEGAAVRLCMCTCCRNIVPRHNAVRAFDIPAPPVSAHKGLRVLPRSLTCVRLCCWSPEIAALVCVSEGQA